MVQMRAPASVMLTYSTATVLLWDALRTKVRVYVMEAFFGCKVVAIVFTPTIFFWLFPMEPQGEL